MLLDLVHMFSLRFGEWLFLWCRNGWTAVPSYSSLCSRFEFEYEAIHPRYLLRLSFPCFSQNLLNSKDHTCRTHQLWAESTRWNKIIILLITFQVKDSLDPVQLKWTCLLDYQLLPFTADQYYWYKSLENKICWPGGLMH